MEEEAGRIISSGGLVAFPTETVYGLGGSAFDPDAAAKIYAAKGRPSDNPLIVHICAASQLEDLADEIPGYARILAERFWPGPMTLVLSKKASVPDTVTGGLGTVAVRFPSCEAACNIGLESTIIDCTGPEPVILRPGYVTAEEVAVACGSVAADRVVEARTREEAEEADTGGGPKAPGMKYKHYSPKAPLTLFEGPAQEVSRRIIARARDDIQKGRRVGILVSDETKGAYQVALSGKPDDAPESEEHGTVIITSLGSSEDMAKVAAGLFAALRAMDDEGADLIYAETFPDEGVGAAVMNRLRKAAGFDIVRVGPQTPAEAPASVFSKVIFAGLANTTQSVICESIFGYLAREKGMDCVSRGVTVLFPEPLNEKAVEILARHGLRPAKAEAQLLEPSDLDEAALILAMSKAVQNRILKNFTGANFVYTLPEFAGEETAIPEPRGGRDEYEACYQTLLRLVTKTVSRIFAAQPEER